MQGNPSRWSIRRRRNGVSRKGEEEEEEEEEDEEEEEGDGGSGKGEGERESHRGGSVPGLGCSKKIKYCLVI